MAVRRTALVLPLCFGCRGEPVPDRLDGFHPLRDQTVGATRLNASRLKVPSYDNSAPPCACYHQAGQGSQEERTWDELRYPRRCAATRWSQR